MSVSYEVFENAFLAKISEYEFVQLPDEIREPILDEYLNRAVSEFRKNCKYDLVSTRDVNNRRFDVDISEDDLYELTNIISEGMVVQWLKPYLYKQDNLENALNTKDFSMYSPAELLKQVGAAHKTAKRDYIQMIREYSYNHGDLTSLHI